MTLRTVPLALVAAVLAVGCTDAPLGTSVDDSLNAPAPEFLIGQSPLIVLIQDPNEPPAVEVTAQVNKGIVNVKDEDKFKTRTTVTFTVNGTAEGTVGPQDFALIGVKDDGVRGGGEVAIIMCMDIPIDLWTKLLAADAQGATIEARATVELVMKDGAGKEHILDEESAGVIMDID